MPSNSPCLQDQYNLKEGKVLPFLNGLYNGCVLLILITVYLLQYNLD